VIEWYDWAGGREAVWRFGPRDGPVVIVSPPLFDEGNRTRRLIVDLLTLLAARGIGGALPDLPGTGESLLDTVDVPSAADWRAAYAAAAATLGSRVYSVAMRGGALIDGDAIVEARWRLSPIAGKTLVREIRHARIMAAAMEGYMLRVGPFERGVGPFPVSGNSVQTDLLIDLTETEIAPGRVVRLSGESGSADRKLDGTGPWRRSEPEADPVLSKRLADDIAQWIAR
jgi:hypothetical protein